MANMGSNKSRLNPTELDRRTSINIVLPVLKNTTLSTAQKSTSESKDGSSFRRIGWMARRVGKTCPKGACDLGETKPLGRFHEISPAGASFSEGTVLGRPAQPAAGLVGLGRSNPRQNPQPQGLYHLQIRRTGHPSAIPITTQFYATN